MLAVRFGLVVVVLAVHSIRRTVHFYLALAVAVRVWLEWVKTGQ